MSQPELRLVAGVAFVASVVTAVLAGCVTPTPTGSPPAASTPSASAPPSPTTASPSPSIGSPSPSASPSPVRLPTQSTVEWGRIWDALPPGFPRPTGGVPSEIGIAASAVFELTEDVATASGVMRGALEATGFRTEGVSGPFEDGSVVIDSVGPTPGCRVQTTTVRQGAVTMMTVLYGASCPFE